MLLKLVFRALLIVPVIAPQIVQAEIKEYVRDYNYQSAIYDTVSSSRANAIDGVRRELLDELGTYVGSVVKQNQDSLGNSFMSHDVITITAGIVAFKLLDEKWKQPIYYVKAGMKADPDDVMKKVTAMRADLELEKSLRDSHGELQNSRNEVAKLKAQLAQMMLARDTQTPAKPIVIVSAPALKPAPAPVATPTSEQKNAQLAKIDLARSIEANKGMPPPIPVPVIAEPAQAPPPPPPVPAPTADKLVAKYVQAVRDVEVGEAFQRAMAARIKGDFGELVREMRPLAEKGYAKAQFRMGWIHEHGLSVPQDFQMAREWYEKAMANGDASAIARMGWLYEHGRSVEKNYSKAANYYKEAIREGNGWGYAHLGWLYQTGKGVQLDKVKAVEYYRLGVEKGNYLAVTHLAFLYQLGQGGLPRDENKAAELYKQAIEHGVPLAMTRISLMYNRGEGGLSKDHAKALALLRESVRYKLPAAYAYMGFMYENGWGVKQDYIEAKKWYEKAVEQDAPFAMFRLGMLYKDGLGVSRDREKARDWLKRAASMGIEPAEKVLDRMNSGRQ